MTEVRKVRRALLVIDMQNVFIGENHAANFKCKNPTCGYHLRPGFLMGILGNSGVGGYKRKYGSLLLDIIEMYAIL